MTDFLFTLFSLSLVMTVLILVLLLTERFFSHRITAKARFTLWVFIVLRLCVAFGFDILPPVIEIPIPEQAVSSEEIPIQPEKIETAPADGDLYQLDDLVQTIQPPKTVPAESIRVIDPAAVLFGIWLTVALLNFTGTIAGYLIFTARLRKRLTPADPNTCRILESIGENMDLRRTPSVRISPSAESPMLLGFFRPMIVLPDMKLDENALAGILSHELIHYRRGDLLIKLLGVLTISLHWFNPAVWLAYERCMSTMELACDEAVLEGQNLAIRSAYGKVMLEILRQNHRKYAPLTTHFQPGKKRIQERFTEIMNNRRRNSGKVLLVLTFFLCINAGGIVGCVREEVTPVSVGGVNLARAEFEFDGYGNLASVTYEDISETKSSVYTGTGVPVFVNGSILAGGDVAVELFGVDGFLVEFNAVFKELYQNKSHSRSRGRTKAEYRVDVPDVIESIEFRHETGEIFVNGQLLEGMSHTTETPEENSFPHQIYVTPEVCAAILKLNAAVFHASGLSAFFYEDQPQSHGNFSSYLRDEMQIIFWRYPAEAVELTEEEALEKLKSALIEAYENTYGRFVPLTEQPASSPYPGDEIMLRWQIPNLSVTGENDRFYRVEFMGEMLIDRWTGDIYRYYNGLAQFFIEFDPDDPGALMFAG